MTEPSLLKTTIVVMGVAGSGKSTVAERLAERLGWPMAEGDDFHSPENRAKMAANTPLTDADRMPWLTAIRDWIDRTPSTFRGHLLGAERSYRDLLRTAQGRVRFVHLTVRPPPSARGSAAATGTSCRRAC